MIKSYVTRGQDCFMISTIDRASSAAAAPDYRYAETIAWEYTAGTAKVGKMLHQSDDIRGSLREHFRICEAYFNTGKPPENPE